MSDALVKPCRWGGPGESISCFYDPAYDMFLFCSLGPIVLDLALPSLGCCRASVGCVAGLCVRLRGRKMADFGRFPLSPCGKSGQPMSRKDDFLSSKCRANVERMSIECRADVEFVSIGCRAYVDAVRRRCG
jgi:hypothetical protein